MMRQKLIIHIQPAVSSKKEFAVDEMNKYNYEKSFSCMRKKTFNTIEFVKKNKKIIIIWRRPLTCQILGHVEIR
jgi:hypothetical protein